VGRNVVEAKKEASEEASSSPKFNKVVLFRLKQLTEISLSDKRLFEVYL
jgi:hypothetical protein